MTATILSRRSDVMETKVVRTKDILSVKVEEVYELSFDEAPTVVFVDWDDTLMASSTVAALGKVSSRKAFPVDVQEQLRSLEKKVIHFLEETRKYGKVCIVTNAECGWVELSGRRFMPAVVSYMLSHGITIISARTKYEHRYPHNPPAWKLRVFRDEVRWCRQVHSQQTCFVISIGDSYSEREAARSLRRTDPYLKVVTVKLVERPSIQVLQGQLSTLSASIEEICSSSEHLDIELLR
eukprot:Plantae.Rhodophyta-Purpureofilum_apyrenoidigerum.ctg2995.p1 GENE.Plantae.Rhodophyta-Purpureofilum_apyrenoidigerum.ctg2995~~Plantae.Rhodophyta-Purpureofilum_apyrenoidigerum.ctg2995.p1  ORF type:complete len:238 (+),score=37.44 Plantae.Rhodophyta-Purpureofilum_apyrenoidigerum.ctg2995:263-976(+)